MCVCRCVGSILEAPLLSQPCPNSVPWPLPCGGCSGGFWPLRPGGSGPSTWPGNCLWVWSVSASPASHLPPFQVLVWLGLAGGEAGRLWLISRQHLQRPRAGACGQEPVAGFQLYSWETKTGHPTAPGRVDLARCLQYPRRDLLLLPPLTDGGAEAQGDWSCNSNQTPGPQLSAPRRFPRASLRS